jgi:hypothetical protein
LRFWRIGRKTQALLVAPQLVAAGVPVVLSPPRPIPVASFDATRAPFAPSLGAVRTDEGGAVTTPHPALFYCAV